MSRPFYGPRCVDCLHWKRPHLAETMLGECRRRAPLAVLETFLPGTISVEGLRPKWPLTRAIDSCGEFEQRPEPEGGPCVEVREIDDGRAA
jgi:hypothetical protein